MFTTTRYWSLYYARIHPLPFYYVNRNYIPISWSSKWSFSLALSYNALFVYMFMLVVVAAA